MLAGLLAGCVADGPAPGQSDIVVPADFGLGIDFDWDAVDLGALCHNGVKDPFETDVDCGDLCPRCAEGRKCASASDCTKEVCLRGVCGASGVMARSSPLARGAPDAFAVGDVTGDGVRDLVAGLGTMVPAYGLAVFRGTGGGQLQEHFLLRYGADEGSNNIVLGDFNSDGRLDVAAGGTLSKRVWVFSNQGSGRFVESKPYEYQNEALPNSRLLAAGDFDGDGDADLVVAAADEGILLYRNGGRGLVAPQRVLPDVVWAMTAARIDGDGALDLLLSSGSVVALTQKLKHLIHVGLTWSEEGDLVAAGDFNGDGWVDVANSKSVSFGDRNGGFPKARAIDFMPRYQMVSGDFNGDGRMDLAAKDGAVWPNESVIVAEGQANGEVRTSWRLRAPSLAGIGAGDLDGDGRDELFVGIGRNGVAPEIRVYSVK